MLRLKASAVIRRLLRAQRSHRVRATLKVAPPGGSPLTKTVTVVFTR